MGILGLLLTLVAVGLSFAFVASNESVFEQSIGTISLMGYSADLTVGQVFMGGLILGALGFFGITLMLTGAGRRASRRVATRRRLREQEAQLREQEAQLREREAERARTDAELDDRAARLDTERLDTRHRTVAEAEAAEEERLAKH